jgi:hypothetical protein
MPRAEITQRDVTIRLVRSLENVMKRRTMISLLVVGVSLFPGGCSKQRGGSSASRPSIRDVVKLYAKGQGSDDIASQQIREMGTDARDGLIAMLDDPNTQEPDPQTIIFMLAVHFPGSESKSAMERYVSRIPDPNQRELAEKVIKEITSTSQRPNRAN